MDEESGQRRILPSSFFDQITKVRETADRALEFSEDNLKVIEETKTSLEGIKFAIEDLKQEIGEFDIEGITNSIKDLKLEVKEINDYITVERKIAQDVQEDLRLETEDTEQKQERSQRLKEMGVPSSDGEQPQPTPAQQVGNALQDNIKQGGAVGGMLGAGLLQLLAPLLGAVMIPGSLAMGLPKLGALGLQNLFKRDKSDKGEKGEGNFITNFFNKNEGTVEETGTGQDKKEESKMAPYDFIQEKGLKVTDVEDMFKRMVHVYNPNVQDKNGDYQGIKVYGTFKGQEQMSTEEFINTHPAFKIKELKPIAKNKGRKKTDKDKDEDKDKGKDNEFIDGVKKGIGDIKEGAGNFFDKMKKKGGKLISGIKESTGNLFGGEKEEEIPKSKYEQLVDAGYTFDDKGFVGGQRMIEFKGPDDGKETFYSKGLGGILGIGEGTKLTGRYKRVESEGGLRTLLGEGSGDSLEDIINRDESLTVPVPEGRSLKSKILGGIDRATGNITDFDQMGGKVTGLSRLLGGTIDAATGNFTDIDKEGGSTFGLTRGITGVADFLTGNKFNLDKKPRGEKKENKLMDFVKGGGVFGFLGRKLGDLTENFDGRPGSRKTKDKENEKAEKERISVIDHLNTLPPVEAGQLVLDEQAKWNKEFQENQSKYTQNMKEFWDSMLRQFMVKVKDPESFPKEMLLEYTNRAKALEQEKISPEGPDDRYKIKSGTVDDEGRFSGFELKDEYKTGGVEPVLESDNKNLQGNVFQPVDSSPTIIVANNGEGSGGGGETGNDAVRVPANPPNTQDSGELMMTDDPSSFIKTIKNEQLNIASSNTIPHQVTQNIK